LVLLGLSGAPAGTAGHNGGHQPPNIGGYLLVGEEDTDGDGDGKTETHILRYQNAAGDRVFSMITKG
jgi:hypothetical protein